MTLRDQVYAQAALLAGQLDQQKQELLGVLCTASTAMLTARMKEGLRPEDCRADFVAAASLLALAGLNSAAEGGDLEQIAAGDLTIRRSGTDAASNCLRNQAKLMIAPYLQDGFAFAGV